MNAETTGKIEEATAALAEPARYDGVSVLLHWITAALVVILWALGQTIDWFPKGAPRIDARSTHFLFGVILGIVLLVRVGWRASAGRSLPLADPGWAGILAKAVHYGLYLMLGATVVLGIFNAWQRGDVVFNLFTIPKFAPGDAALKHTLEELHGDFADVVLIVAGLHAAAALVHHYLLRDSVLRRMWP
ncbi:MAG TPA: cytochrome b [Steroidobacteraceae bacterium]|nr:cytochrome b [Steroidobacteraceae bacterium]